MESLIVRCRFGLRPAAYGEWEQDPEGCPVTCSASDMESHEATCPHKPLMCKWKCGTQLRPRDLGAHEAACAGTQMLCSFVGCHAVHTRAEAEKHMAEAAELHARSEHEQRLQFNAYPEIVGAANTMILRSITVNGIPQLLAAMRLCPGNAHVVGQACAAFTTICKTEDSRIKAGDAGAIHCLVATMQAHLYDAGVQEKACSALYNMIISVTSNKQKAVHAGATEAAVAAMQAHPDSSAVQKEACSLLYGIQAGNIRFVISFEAIEAVLSALQAHRGSADVIVKVCKALAILANGVRNIDESNRQRAVGAGALEALVAVMVAHRDQWRVQEKACSALAVLTGWVLGTPGGNFMRARALACRAIKEKASDSGAIDAVVAAMQAHPGSAVVQEKACSALANMIVTMDDININTERASAAGARQAVQAAMHAHPGSESLQKEARRALTNMGGAAELRRFLEESPALVQAASAADNLPTVGGL